MAVMDTVQDSYELGPIRPPSEAHSLLVRVTRNCPWNRCKFCSIYKGQKFEVRSVSEIKRDIDVARAIHDSIINRADISGQNVLEAAAAVYRTAPGDGHRNVALWMYAGGVNAFLQDANSLVLKTGDLLEVIKYLKESFPGIERITSYARSITAARKSLQDLIQLHEAGLSRVHIGLESGYNPVLELMDKGVTAADHIAGGSKIVASGISLCEYVILGLGGKNMWREHALETARVLNEINPDFIRLRTLTIHSRMPLYNDVVIGDFVRTSDEEIITELRLFIEHLECKSYIISDHIINLLAEIEGRLPEDKQKILAVIERFQSLPSEERDIYKLGRRLSLFDSLDDLENNVKRGEIERVMKHVREGGQGNLDAVLVDLIERYI